MLGNKYTDFFPIPSPTLVECLYNIDPVGSSLFKFLIKEINVPLGYITKRNIETKVSLSEQKSKHGKRRHTARTRPL